MCLFKEFERTHDGPGDPGESFYKYIYRSSRLEAAQARDLCNRWFADYANDASEDELSRFLGDFRSKGLKQHYAAWFELLTHQLLVRLGFSVTVHPDLPGNDKHPDFEASSNGYRILVEATVVAPDNDPFAPSDFERDVQEKFSQLEIANFTARIARVSGTLKAMPEEEGNQAGIRKTRRQIRSRRSPTPDRSVRLRSGANGDYPLRRLATPGRAISPAS